MGTAFVRFRAAAASSSISTPIFLDGQDTDSESGGLDNDKCPGLQRIAVLAQGAQNDRADACGQHVLGSDLDDAGPGSVRQREQMAEVEVVREDDETMLPRPPQDFAILGF